MKKIIAGLLIGLVGLSSIVANEKDYLRGQIDGAEKIAIIANQKIDEYECKLNDEYDELRNQMISEYTDNVNEIVFQYEVIGFEINDEIIKLNDKYDYYIAKLADLYNSLTALKNNTGSNEDIEYSQQMIMTALSIFLEGKNSFNNAEQE